MHDRFVNAVKAFAADHAVPLMPFEKGQDRTPSSRRIGPATPATTTWWSLAVNHDYFYLQDADWGPAFIKILVVSSPSRWSFSAARASRRTTIAQQSIARGRLVVSIELAAKRLSYERELRNSVPSARALKKKS